MSRADTERREPRETTTSARSRPSWKDYWTAAQTISTKDFENVPSIPCARNSLLYGIGGGTAIGCTRYLTSSVFVASNWAVASFILIAAASWQRCRAIQLNETEMVKRLKESQVEKLRQRTAISTDTTTTLDKK